MEIYSADWVLPIEGPPIPRGAVAVENGRIAAVGPTDELGEGEHHDGCVLFPGLVNAHSHLEYAVYGGFGDGLSFGPWLDVHIERKRRLEWEDVVAVARLGAAMCLESGITTVADASFSGAAAPACDELGLRAIVHLEVFGSDVQAGIDTFERHRERIAPSLSDRVTLGISPHAAYSVGTELFEAALDLGLPAQTHLAESADEIAFLRDGEGPVARIADLCGVGSPGVGPVELLAANGLLRPSLTAAHCVKIGYEEIEGLARSDVAVAHCPRSNAQLGCGVAPVAELRAAGVRVGLGTDSPASASSFDMFEEMRAALALARLRATDPAVLAAGNVLELATLGSARAIGLADEIGSLAPGKRADLTVLSLEGSGYLPCEDPGLAVVLSGTPARVSRTMVGGVTRYQRGGSEWHELRQSAADARARMLAPLSR